MDDDKEWRNRIEQKLDKMTEAITSLARVEERMAHCLEEQGRQHDRLNGHAKRLRRLEETGVVVSGIGRIVWLAVAAVVGGLFALFFKKVG